LLAAAQGRASPALCLLGAGNCNDVELAALVAAYARIRLVDCDLDAIEQGLTRQGLAGHAAIQVHGHVELSGLVDLPPAAPLEARVEAVEKAPWPPGVGPVEVVASLCVLSQLLELAFERGNLPGSNDPEQALALVQAVRLRHLRLMTELLVPGGEATLITDCVSSDTVPALQTVSDADLPALLSACIARRNFFTGLNPAVLIDLLRHDPVFKDHVTGIAPIAPWRWQLGPRTYAVYALRWARRTNVDSAGGT
jgi:hypothetical protein